MVLSFAIADARWPMCRSGERRTREQRRAIAGRQRGAVAIEQRLGRLPRVVPLPALEADGGQPLQRRAVAAVAPVRSRIQRQRAVVLARRLGGGADGEVTARPRRRWARRAPPADPARRRPPASFPRRGESARPDPASLGSSGRWRAAVSSNVTARAGSPSRSPWTTASSISSGPLRFGAGRQADFALQQRRDLRPVALARRQRAQRRDRLGQRRVERHRAPIRLARRARSPARSAGPPASEVQRRRGLRRQPRRAPSQLVGQLARAALALVHPLQRRDRLGVAADPDPAPPARRARRRRRGRAPPAAPRDPTSARDRSAADRRDAGARPVSTASAKSRRTSAASSGGSASGGSGGPTSVPSWP